MKASASAPAKPAPYRLHGLDGIVIYRINFDALALEDVACTLERDELDEARFEADSRETLFGAQELALREGRGRVVLESSLRGLASALPPPFAKEAAQPLPPRFVRPRYGY